MQPTTQEVDPIAYALMEQRNTAMNEAAYWRVQATKAQAALAELRAKLPAEEKKDDSQVPNP